MGRRGRTAVPELLAAQVEQALAALEDAQEALSRVVDDRPPLQDRRDAHVRVRRAFDVADELLRQATTLARQESHREWSQWRHRLSSLDTARQLHLLAEQDELGLLPLGSVRAVDTGMSGPDLGDLLHGASRDPGTPPRYGLDLEALLTAPAAAGPAAEPPHARVIGTLARRQAVPGPATTPLSEPPREVA